MENKRGNYYLTMEKRYKYQDALKKLAAQASAKGVKSIRVDFMKSRVRSELACDHWGKALQIMLYFKQNYID